MSFSFLWSETEQMHKCHLLEAGSLSTLPACHNLTGHCDTVGIHCKRQLAVHLQTIQNMKGGVGVGKGEDEADKCAPAFMVAPVEIIIAFAHHKYHRVKNSRTTSQLALSTCNLTILTMKCVKTCFWLQKSKVHLTVSHPNHKYK